MVVGNLPETYEEFVEAIEWHDKDSDPGSAINQWAIGLGVSGSCARCGTAIVDAYGFAEALVNHFGLKGKKVEDAFSAIEVAVENSGAECGSSMCGYCTYQMNKDD